jgi:hypothetical protein
MKLAKFREFEGYGDGYVLSFGVTRRFVLLEIEVEKSVMESYTVLMQLGCTSLFHLSVSLARYGVSLSVITKNYEF